LETRYKKLVEMWIGKLEDTPGGCLGCSTSAELFANELLIFEYEKYSKTLGTYELLNYLKKAVIQVNPSQEEIDVCATFFPESELSDIVHAATCLYADAILITNDRHFNKIKEIDVIEVWSNTKAIKRLLDGLEDYEDP
jgi:hypothetical protein